MIDICRQVLKATSVSLDSPASPVQRVVLGPRDRSAAKVSRAIPVSPVLREPPALLVQVVSRGHREDRDRKVRRAVSVSRANQARVARSVLMDSRELLVTTAHREGRDSRATPAQVEAKVRD